MIQWRAKVVGDGTADIPFIGASDIEMPLTAIHSDPVYADFMQSLHAPPDFWSVKAQKPDMVEYADPLQEFMSVVERNYLKMRRVNSRALLDVTVHGTGIYKDSILHERKKVQDYGPDGNIASITKLKFQPFVEHVPLQDFFQPAYAWNIDPDDIGGAPWVGHRFRLTRGAFNTRKNASSPFIPAYDKDAATIVEAWERNIQGEDPVLDAVQQQDSYIPWRDYKIELFEIWARYDIDGDGVEEDIVVVWHHRTRQILRTVFNPFIHGKRPFEAGKYLPGFGFYGIGIAEVDEWAQRGISRLLNSTIDNAFLANTVMLGVPIGANIMPDEAIYAGKIWPLGPNERISEVRMGQPYPGMFNIIGELAQWSEQRTAVNELRQGNIHSLPSRTPASSLMQMLSEGNKRFDMIMTNLREGALGNIGCRVLQNLVQISKDDPRFISLALQSLGQEDGGKVAEILQGPVYDIEANFGVNVTATSSKVNKEVDKQNLIALAQYMAQASPQRLQYAQALVQMKAAPPTLITGELQASYNSNIEINRRLLEAYDVQNPDQYLPPPAPAPTVAPQAQPGVAPAPGAPGAPGAPAGAPVLPQGGPMAASPLAQGSPQLAALLGLA